MITKILTPTIEELPVIGMSERERIISNLVRNKSHLISLDLYARYHYKDSGRYSEEVIPNLDTYRDSHLIESYDLMDCEIEKFLNKNQEELVEDINNDPDYSEVTKVELILNARFYNSDYDFLEESGLLGQISDNKKSLYDLQNELNNEIFPKYGRALEVARLIIR